MMKALVRAACVLGSVLALVVAVRGQEGGVKAQIDKANAAFTAALAKGDAAALAGMYTSDAQVLPPNSEVVRGADAIQKVWQSAIEMGAKSMKLESTEVEAHGTMAHEVGSYAVHGADGKELDRGKYVVIWKREQNAWKLHRDIWNTSMPTAR